MKPLYRDVESALRAIYRSEHSIARMVSCVARAKYVAELGGYAPGPLVEYLTFIITAIFSALDYAAMSDYFY